MARADKESRLFLSTSAEVEACSGPSASKTGQILHLLARCRVFVSLIGTLVYGAGNNLNQVGAIPSGDVPLHHPIPSHASPCHDGPAQSTPSRARGSKSLPPTHS
ncbi:hypothetical protein CGCF413_v004980 [Colletotrichum fructicola]|nr:hypothetical protein CGCF413_v004980 [Colletotrichum fructicola]